MGGYGSPEMWVKRVGILIEKRCMKDWRGFAATRPKRRHRCKKPYSIVKL